MVVESREITKGDPSAHTPVKISVLNLIDLAGSERASNEAANGELRRKEGAYINKSLLTLGQVISKLSEKTTDSGHIPYRDSKLTRILQNSLGGNAKISVICTISLSHLNFEETNSTLKFASRAKKIKNKVSLNEVTDDKTLIRRYQTEITDLKKKLEDAQNAQHSLEELEQIKSQKENLEANFSELNEKLAAQDQAVAAYQEKIRHLTRLILNSNSVATTLENPTSPRGGDSHLNTSGERAGRRLSMYRSGANKITAPEANSSFSGDFLSGSPQTPRVKTIDLEIQTLKRENEELREKLEKANRAQSATAKEKLLQETVFEQELQMQILRADNAIITEQLRDSESEVESLKKMLNEWKLRVQRLESSVDQKLK
eukprot:TRINITY_DN5344_c0_g1_i1.p1 TRINITY_DN5344_c0_g1~~TRINITY_DN5344_c0_g1_i1.p1  ORF type:complete len:374 (+),score=139.11 TRINITY_DN5344_c0_g1_i1:1082-2203(+)